MKLSNLHEKKSVKGAGLSGYQFTSFIFNLPSKKDKITKTSHNIDSSVLLTKKMDKYFKMMNFIIFLKKLDIIELRKIPYYQIFEAIKVKKNRNSISNYKSIKNSYHRSEQSLKFFVNSLIAKKILYLNTTAITTKFNKLF
mmetsp:Transcript_18725/g.26360  ORF Transcript_18725/g.26360 Transcript_18725/m.26360 type:complete len:141 (-) Transcript_18725:108-530(-)